MDTLRSETTLLSSKRAKPLDSWDLMELGSRPLSIFLPQRFLKLTEGCCSKETKSTEQSTKYLQLSEFVPNSTLCTTNSRLRNTSNSSQESKDCRALNRKKSPIFTSNTCRFRSTETFVLRS